MESIEFLLSIPFMLLRMWAFCKIYVSDRASDSLRRIRECDFFFFFFNHCPDLKCQQNDA